jgi:serine protease AprX
MENKRTLKLMIFILLLGQASFSQYTKYWVQFTDKNNSPYFLSNPSQYLSARAIQRRLNQHIPLAVNDLPVIAGYVDSLKKIPGVVLLNHSRWFNAVTIYTTDTNALNKIKALRFVKDTKPVRRLSRNKEEEGGNGNWQYGTKFPFINKSPIQSPGMKYESDQQRPAIAASYTYGLSFNQVNMLGGVCMHNRGFDGKGMEIAILDVGFDRLDSAAAFDSLRANNQILGRRNFVDQNNEVAIPGEVHGTWCLSLMAGNIPGQLIGTAPKANYWLLRTEDGATENVIEEDNWVSGAEFADSVGADVLSTSLGYTEFDSVKTANGMIVNPANHTYADMNGHTTRISIGTNIAASKGMLPVCSAGNMGWSPWHFIGAPADADSALAVGAVDNTGTYAGFSSKGPSYDGRVKPNIAAQGDHPYTTDLAQGSYNLYSGTSFACPLAAGMAACLWQAHPLLTNMQLYDAIQRSASLYPHPDSLTGYGIPNFCAAHDSLLAVHEPMFSESVLIYPNPSRGIVQIKCEKIKINSMEIQDVLGNSMYKSWNVHFPFSIDLSSYSSGVYFVKLNFGEGSIVRKLVIE